MKCCLACICVCLVFLIAPTTLADPPATQEATGTVTGLAIDTAGNPLAECVISATEAAQRMRVARTAETDKDGKFSLELPEASWTITATTKDTKLKGAKSVDVTVGKIFDLGKITLRPRKVGAR
jgi:hypothetical protein